MSPYSVFLFMLFSPSPSVWPGFTTLADFLKPHQLQEVPSDYSTGRKSTWFVPFTVTSWMPNTIPSVRRGLISVCWFEWIRWSCLSRISQSRLPKTFTWQVIRSCLWHLSYSTAVFITTQCFVAGLGRSLHSQGMGRNLLAHLNTY